MGDVTNPWEPLGLPATWQPAQIVWRWGQFTAQTPNGIETLDVLIIDTPTGRYGFAFPKPSMQVLHDQVIERAGGITVARLAPVEHLHPNGK